jgi:hypothetical protein
MCGPANLLNIASSACASRGVVFVAPLFEAGNEDAPRLERKARPGRRLIQREFAK